MPSDLNIALFNVNSSDKVSNNDRLVCLKFVLTEVKKTCRGPLFVLCQDKITDGKDEILKSELGDDNSHT